MCNFICAQDIMTNTAAFRLHKAQPFGFRRLQKMALVNTPWFDEKFWKMDVILLYEAQKEGRNWGNLTWHLNICKTAIHEGPIRPTIPYSHTKSTKQPLGHCGGIRVLLGLWRTARAASSRIAKPARRMWAQPCSSWFQSSTAHGGSRMSLMNSKSWCD